MVTNVKRPIVESHQIYGALSSEADERVLPEWLNAARGTASCKRVIQIIELIRRIDKSTSEALARGAFHHVFKPGKPRRYPKEKMKMQRAADLSLARLSRTLKRYTFRVAATKIILGGWQARVYCPRRKDDFSLELHYGTKAAPGEKVLSSPTFRVLEGDAVLAVLRLAARGILSRVVLCAKCSETWLFARHGNYRFCSPACRESYFTNTDEYRGRKAAAMRRYRDRLRKW